MTAPDTNSASAVDVHLRVLEAVQRLERRLDRLEERLEPALTLVDEAPATLATAGDIVDDLLVRKGDVDQRLRGLVDLVDRITEPTTLASLQHAVNAVDDAPHFVAFVGDLFDATVARIPDFDERLRRTVGLVEQVTRPEILDAAEGAVRLLAQAPDMAATTADILDAWAQRANDAGIEMGRIVEVVQQFVQGLLRLSTSPEVQRFLDSAMLRSETVDTLSAAATALAETREAPTSKVGAFGALRAMGDPDVQAAVGFGLTFAKTFGQSLAGNAHTTAQTSLTSGSTT